MLFIGEALLDFQMPVLPLFPYIEEKEDRASKQKETHTQEK
jgi:hypothetical protein